jgi:putative membrane protein
MGAWWLLGLVATMAIIWLLVNGGRRVGPPPESPDEILKRRYARGEISSDEYRRMRDELRA